MPFKFVLLILWFMMLSACHYPPRPTYMPPREVVQGCQDAFDEIWAQQSYNRRDVFREFWKKYPGWRLRLMLPKEKDRLIPQTRCSRKQYMLLNHERMWAVELCESHPPIITPWPPPD